MESVSQGSRLDKNSDLLFSNSVLSPFYGFVSERFLALKNKSKLYSILDARTQVKAYGYAMENVKNYGMGRGGCSQSSCSPSISCKMTSKGWLHSCGLITGSLER